MNGMIAKVLTTCTLIMVLFACSSKGGGSPDIDQRPKNITATPGPGAGRITIAWDPAAGRPQGYNLSGHALKSGVSSLTTVTNVSSPYVYSVRSPDIGYTHEFFVTALYSGSEYASDTITAMPVQRTPDPALVPQNINVVPGPDRGQISISWDSVAGNPRYELSVHANTWASGAESVLENALSPVNYTAFDADLSAQHTFYLKTILGDSEGISGSLTAYPLYQMPGNIAAAPGPGAGQITITWDPAPAAPLSYNLYCRALRSGATTTTRANVTSPHSYTVLSPEITYEHECYVAALYSSGEFASLPVRTTPVQRTIDPALAPQNFEARSGPGSGQMITTWDSVAGSPRYELYIRANTWPIGTVSVQVDASSPATYTALNSALSATHEFYLKSIVGDSEGITGTISVLPL